MFRSRYAQASVAAMIMTTLAACSSGGGDNATGGSTNVLSSGTITAFGSVIVNGVRYETENARIVSEDDGSVIINAPTDDQLQLVLGLGEVITVLGTRSDDNNGVAGTIRVDNELVGEVISVNAMDGSFVVLSQTVSVSPDTIIDDSIIEVVRGVDIPGDLRFGDLPETLDQLLTAGMVVEVSGFPSQNGIEATRIEDVGNQTAPGGGTPDDEVKGFVSQLDPGISFMINGLTVFYDVSALDSEDFANRTLAEGDFVEVHGDAIAGTSSMNAFRIELEDDLVDDDFVNGEIEIEGVIQQVLADATGTGGVILINDLELRVDDISQFSEGLRVEIEGILQANGSIVLTRLQDEAEDTVHVEDAIVSTDGDSLLTRLGLDLMPTDRTRLEDDTIEDDDNLAIADFLASAAGKRIEARGFLLNGVAVWTRMEIEDDDDTDCRLRGPIAGLTGDVSDFSFTIEDVTVVVSQVAESDFAGVFDQPIGRAAFFDALSAGTIVEATSDDAGSGCVHGTLTAHEVQLEPEDDVLVGDDDNFIDDDNGVNEDQINGTVSNVTVGSFVLSGEIVTVDDSTMIDDSIIEAARGEELSDDLPLGDLPETLPELLPEGLSVVVGVDRSNGVLAIYIEND